VFDLHETGAQPALQRHLATLLVGTTSVLLAAAAALAIAARQDEAAQAHLAAAAAEREADYRGLLLDEMKHRLKNHIARIQSIARQGARGATDVRAFTDIFDARLQSMAAVQEILAGTIIPQADLRAILRKELQQCLDADEVEHLMDGPLVRMDERQSHAFSLIAHELVTNALKYGGLSENGMGLTIQWRVDDPGAKGKPVVVMDWSERLDPAGSKLSAQDCPGFGSRLIDVSLRGELAGSIERTVDADGLRIILSFPLNAAVSQDEPAAAAPRADGNQPA